MILGLAMAETTVRYTNDAITEKLYGLRDTAGVGAGPVTEIIPHGAKVKVEFSVEQPSAGVYKNRMTYHLQKPDGTWKKLKVDYECKVINMKQLCYGKTCPIAEYKPPKLPKKVEECVMVSKEASEVLEYMIVNNPEVVKNSKPLDKCIKDAGKPDKKIEEICFNKAIGNIEKVKAEMAKKGFKLVTGPDGNQHWIREVPA